MRLERQDLASLHERLSTADAGGMQITRRETSIFRFLVRVYLHVTGQVRGAEGHFLTIGSVRAQGVTRLTIFCTGSPQNTYCRNTRVFKLDDLGLPEPTIFARIPTARKFVCERCGGSNVTVMACHEYPLAKQA